MYRVSFTLVVGASLAMAAALVWIPGVHVELVVTCWLVGVVLASLLRGLGLTFEVRLAGQLAAGLANWLAAGLVISWALLGAYSALVFAAQPPFGPVFAMVVLLISGLITTLGVWLTFRLPDKLARWLAERYSGA